jgi:hypothetical protein
VLGGTSPGTLDDAPVLRQMTPGDAGLEPGMDAGPRMLRWPRVFALAPRGGDASRAFSFHAQVDDLGGHLVGETRLIRTFVEGRVIYVRLVLDDRCRGIECGKDERCEAGSCIPADDPGDLDAGVPGTDGGPPMSCTTAEECDDGTYCNGTETCVGGACMPGPRVDCNDGVACTDDRCAPDGCRHLPDPALCTATMEGVCDPVSGCQYPTCEVGVTCVAGPCERVSCDDTRCMRMPLCSATEQCCAGACVPLGCDDGSPCTRDVCTESGCMHPQLDAVCDDGNACTSGDTCRGGVCLGTSVDCEDGNPCTSDSCSPVSGTCTHFATSGTCDDSDPCTIDDVCVGSGCQGSALPCDDTVGCTADSCVDGTCRHVPDDAVCTVRPLGTCDPMAGCQYGETCDMASCVAGPCESAICVGGLAGTCVRDTLCGASQMCCAGSCVPSGCDDGNPCTNDACGGTGCTHTNNTNACNDGIACTVGDQCSGGMCRGTNMVCNDGNPCTNDFCMLGTCRVSDNDSASCDDGLVCTTNWCNGGSCRSAPRVCDDGNECTGDSCVAPAGCVYTNHTGACTDDGFFCTIDVCADGACIHRRRCPVRTICDEATESCEPIDTDL